MDRFFLGLVKKIEILSAVGIRLTVLTGKSETLIHPKHLIKKEPAKYYQYFTKTDSVLDIGCHAGEHSFKISPLVKEVIGIDYDQKFLKLAEIEKKIRKIKNVTFVSVDIEKKLSFPNRRFNKVIFLDVLEHLINRNLALKEIHRVLKKDGLMVIAVPNSQTSWKKRLKKAGLLYFSDPDHKVEYTASEIKNLLVRSGFKIEEFTPISFDTWINPIIDLIGGVSLTLYSKLQNWKEYMVNKYPTDASGFLIITKKVID